ncbi:MAG: prepilin-type N-terminal cleavage/methylation domain-containing protein [Candidatus Dadabacteria bacterium]|nr:MAG: prepilin-type N-terminal cleavage/methylation domain-containing protein [Candidatus Dadabacteria bacterium]
MFSGSDRGFTLLELLVTLSLSGVLMGVALFNIKELDDPLKNSAALSASYLKQVRARAISTTSAYRIRPLSENVIIAESAKNCSATSWTSDNSLKFNLPDGTHLESVNWSVCISGRGMPEKALQFQISDTAGNTRQVELFLAGAVRYQ